jgi:hypothetical protein
MPISFRHLTKRHHLTKCLRGDVGPPDPGKGVRNGSINSSRRKPRYDTKHASIALDFIAFTFFLFFLSKFHCFEIDCFLQCERWFGLPIALPWSADPRTPFTLVRTRDKTGN